MFLPPFCPSCRRNELTGCRQTEKSVNMFSFHVDTTLWFCSVMGHANKICSNEGSHIKRCRNKNKSISNQCSLPSAPTNINTGTHTCVMCVRMCVCYLHGGRCGAGGRRRAVCKGNIGDGKELLFAEDGDKGNAQHQTLTCVRLAHCKHPIKHRTYIGI